MQQLYQSPASRSFLFTTLITVVLALVLWSCDIIQDVSMLEEPYPVKFKEGKIYPSDYGSHQSFGSHIDIWDNYALVGSDKENGAYVFKYEDNEWIELKKLELRANYGIGDVCFKGEWIFVGTQYANGTGKVEAYQIFEDEITLIQEIHAHVDNDRFGSSIDVSGDFLIIGAKAPWRDCEDCNLDVQPGKAYIYKLSGGHWVLEADFDASPALQNDGFGREVAISDNFAFVKGGNGDSVYVYSNLNGYWGFHSYLRPTAGSIYEKDFIQDFGHSIQVEGNTLMIGAPEYQVNGHEGRLGAVYIYELQDGNEWVYKELILNPNSVPTAEVNEFGATLKMDGDYLIVGGETTYIGGCVVYKNTGYSWVNTHYIEPPDDIVTHGFGISMDISDQWMLVGHSGDMDAGKEAGAVYVFENNY
jgi:hypothetical protein